MINSIKQSSSNDQNENFRLHVLSVGCYVKAVDDSGDDPLPELKTLVKESTGKAIRRITRFVQLALIGASRCCKEVEVDKNASVYFASCRGDTGVTVDLLNGLVRDQQPPAPLTFVNSVSNAACFQVAKSVDVFGSSNFITNRYDPIFAALQLVQSDFKAGSSQSALIGSVDCCSLPLGEHRRRIGVEVDQCLAEASNWLLVSSSEIKKDSQHQKTIATIEDVKYFSNMELLIAWLESKDFSGDSVLGVGQYLSEIDAVAIMKKAKIDQRFDYFLEQGYYDSPTGEGIVRFIKERSVVKMLHVNSDPSGRFTALTVINR